jgi:predicted nucleic acid-binding protein
MRIERGTRLLIDTNVLIEATDEGRRFHSQAVRLFREAPERGVDLVLATQILREYLVVATRPVENNGLGMAMPEALDNLRQFRGRASLIAETMEAGELFLKWAGQFGIRGKKLHDLQIVATATTGGMDALITANEEDFPDCGALAIVPLGCIELPPGQ